MKPITCSFLGLGLIGGSLAKAIRERMPEAYIKAYDTDEACLELAVKEGVVNERYSALLSGFFRCDYLFLCAPVSVNLQNLQLLPAFLPEEALISDVGSVKGGIHRQIRKLGLQERFIGGHPMTGSERCGYANSHAGLLENAYYILTPEPEVSDAKTEEFRRFIERTGALPYVLTVKAHDRATAAISHLPHLIASSLVNLVQEGDDEQATLRTLAAGGFKDITRIASSSPALWQQICLENKEELLFFLRRYTLRLEEIAETLEQGDGEGLLAFFEEARLYRDSFTDTRSGPLMKQFTLSLDIPDRSGAIAAVSGLLAGCGISIKNMGITHNRELQEGALSMELYSAADLTEAARLLNEAGYAVHR